MTFLDSAADPKIANRRPLLFFLLATLAVGALASVFTVPNIPTWYEGLVKPPITPPVWVFPPVWTTLYVIMAVAAWRVWRRGASFLTIEMGAYGVQLALNFAWCAIFFAAHQIGAALIEAFVLALAVLVTGLLFGRRDRLAGLIFLPYFAWACFAAALNYAFWTHNP